MRLTVRRLLLLLAFGLSLTLSLLWPFRCRPLDPSPLEHYSRDAPLVFVGGVPQSGAPLLRSLLGCSPETHLVPRLLAMRQAWSRSGREKARLDEAGVTEGVLDAAVAAFVLTLIAQQKEEAGDGGGQRQQNLLCSQDPFALRSTAYLARIFPNSRFILMLRDGRSVARSLMSHEGGVPVAGFDLRSFPSCLSKWSAATEAMFAQCLQVGPSRCLPLRYERLVLRPESALREVAEFLGVAWSPAFLRQQQEAILAKADPVTDSWSALGRDLGPEELERLAPMLLRLGYATRPPTTVTQGHAPHNATPPTADTPPTMGKGS